MGLMVGFEEHDLRVAWQGEGWERDTVIGMAKVGVL